LVGTLVDTCEFDARRDIDLVEDVAEMALDRFLAESNPRE